MSVFYLLFTLIDVVLIVLGNAYYKEENFTCYYKYYLVVTSEWGAFYMLIHSSFFFLFAIMIWDIFYRLPLVHGLMVTKFLGPKLTVKSFALGESGKEKGYKNTDNDDSLIVKDFMNMNQSQARSNSLQRNNSQFSNPLSKNDSDVTSPRKFGRDQTSFRRQISHDKN